MRFTSPCYTFFLQGLFATVNDKRCGMCNFAAPLRWPICPESTKLCIAGQETQTKRKEEWDKIPTSFISVDWSDRPRLCFGKDELFWKIDLKHQKIHRLLHMTAQDWKYSARTGFGWGVTAGSFVFTSIRGSSEFGYSWIYLFIYWRRGNVM